MTKHWIRFTPTDIQLLNGMSGAVESIMLLSSGSEVQVELEVPAEALHKALEVLMQERQEQRRRHPAYKNGPLALRLPLSASERATEDQF